MARIRTIKPEFPHSESMGNVSRDARLTFVELWTLADDEGRLRGNSRMLASLLFPYDDDAPSLIDGWLGELERTQSIIRYQIDGASYVQVCNWLTHQKIDKPSKSKLPEPPRKVAKSREDSSEDQGSRIKEGIKDLGSTSAPAAPSDDDSRGTPETEDWFLNFKLAYPARAGDYRWHGARKAANARIAEGHTPQQFIDGAKRYAAFCESTGKLNTEHVKQAATFLGPDKPFMDAWDLPAAPAAAKRAESERVEWVNLAERAERVGFRARTHLDDLGGYRALVERAEANQPRKGSQPIAKLLGNAA